MVILAGRIAALVRDDNGLAAFWHETGETDRLSDVERVPKLDGVIEFASEKVLVLGLDGGVFFGQTYSVGIPDQRTQMIVLGVHGLSRGYTAGLGQVDDLSVGLVTALAGVDHRENGGDCQYGHTHAGELEDGRAARTRLGQGLGLGDFALAGLLAFAFLAGGFLVGFVEEGHGSLEAGIIAVGPGLVWPIFLSPRQGNLQVGITVQAGFVIFVKRGGIRQPTVNLGGLCLFINPVTQAAPNAH